MFAVASEIKQGLGEEMVRKEGGNIHQVPTTVLEAFFSVAFNR